MNILNRFSIKTKLSFVIMILGLLSLIFIIIYEARLYDEYTQSKQISNYTDISVQNANIIHEIQIERAITSGFINSHGEKFSSKLTEQRKVVDNKIEQFNSYINTNIGKDNPIYGLLSNALSDVQKLKSIRSDADNFSVTTIVQINIYNSIIKSLLSMSDHIKDISAEYSYINKYTNSLYYFAWYKEYIGEVRAQLNSAFSKGILDIDTYKNFNRSYYSSQISLDDFNKFANENYLNKLQNYDNNDDYKFVKKSIETSLNNPNSVSLNISSIDWFDNITSYINNLKNIENDISNDALKVANDKNSSLYFHLIIISSIVLFVILVIYYIAYLIISSIIRNIKLATQLAVNISNGIMIDIK